MYANVGELPKWLKPPSKITGDWLLKTALPVAGATAAIAGAASPKVREFFSNVLGFFKQSGMQAGAAEALANQVTAGREPVPPQLVAQLRAQQAGMFGGMGMPLMLVAIGGVVLVMMMPKRQGGRKRGR